MSMHPIAGYAEAVRLACGRLSWLEHLFTAIAHDADAGVYARSLAEVGRFIAADVADFAGDACADLVAEVTKGDAA